MASAEITQSYDQHVPRTAHDGFAAAMYVDTLRSADSVLNVGAGLTDLGADLRGLGVETRVTSLDPQYGHAITSTRPDQVSGIAQAMPFEDESFAMTICQFAAQHMQGESLGEAVREMVRVTRTAEGPNDGSQGVIFINPIFKERQLVRALDTLGMPKNVGVAVHDADKFTVANRKQVYPTMWIHKTADLTQERVDAIIGAMDASNAMKSPRRSLGEMASRAFGGKSRT